MRQYFNINATGVDLGNIDIKESTKNYHRVVLTPKDEEAEYLLCYDHDLKQFALIDKQDIPRIRKPRSLYFNRIERIAKFITDSPKIMLQSISEYLKDKNYVKISQKELEMETTKIVVVDIETTDKNSYKNDLIVEIGITELDLQTGNTKPLFNHVVKEDGFGDKHRNSWIFENSDLTFEEVCKAPDLKIFLPELQKIFQKYYATAYNKQFDFGFLGFRGLSIDHQLPCPMLVATNVLKIQHYYGWKWPKVQEAWDFFFPNSDYEEEHRGYDDAEHEAKIVYKMYQLGHYPINLQEN